MSDRQLFERIMRKLEEVDKLADALLVLYSSKSRKWRRSMTKKLRHDKT